MTAPTEPRRHVRDSLGHVAFVPLDGATIKRIEGQGAGVPPVDLCPPDVLNRELGPAPLAMRRWESSAARALCALRASSLRERVAQQDAMDAPFKDMARSRFFVGAEGFSGSDGADASAASGGGVAAGLAGLVTSKTSCSTVREEVEIDRLLSRVRRLGKAVRNSAHALDSAAHLSGGFLWRRLFVTLTYRDVDDWKPLHLSAFAKHVRNWFKRKARVPMRMVWVLELQQRGAVHYHCMLWIPARCRFPEPDKAGWWRHGSTNVAAPKGGIQRPVSYMAKYASKVTPDQAGRVPKGARMHGACGLDVEGKRWVRYWRAPLFARDALGGAADIRKVNGGYMDKLTGEFVASPWKVTITPGGRVIAWRLLPQITEGNTHAN
ncbi:rolling circle replication-associated protein [Frateuria sp. YIM B11624]|uniref:rolling circle replication-associated protein n=1 Tax=Frateuria sp. YIM B11624 TaxID=3143185 RepID=UPI003C74B045